MSRASAGSSSQARRIALWAGGILGALVLAYAGLAFLFQVLLDPATVSDWVEPRAEAALNRDVELGGVRPSVFPTLGIDFTGVEVGNPAGFEGSPLVRVERVRLRVALLPLLRREIRVDEVRVEAPRIRLAVDADGTSNFGDLLPEGDSTAPGGDSPLSLAVRELRVVDGAVAYENEPDSTGAAVEGLDVTASLGRRAGGAWAVELEAASRAVELGHPVLGETTIGLSGPALETRLAVDPEAGRLDLGEGELRVGEVTLRLTGMVEGIAEPVRRVDLRLRGEGLAVERFLAAAPGSFRERLPGPASGRIRVDVALRGAVGPERPPALRGDVELSEVSLAGAEGRALASGIGGNLRLRGDSVRIDEIGGTVLGGPFALDAVVVRDELLPVAGRIEVRSDLARLRGLEAMPDGVELRGRLGAGVSVAGSLRMPAELLLEGAVRFSGTELRHPRLGVPVRIEDGSVELTGRAARFSELAVDLGPERIRLNGVVRDPLALLSGDPARVPAVDADVRAGTLTLDRIVPPRGDPEVTYGRIAFAHLGGRSLDGESAERVAAREGLVRPSLLPLRAGLDVVLDTLVSPPFTLQNVEARVEIEPDRIAVPDAAFVVFGGDVTTSVELALGQDPAQPFRLTLTADGSRAADFLAATSPLRSLITGRLGLELRAEGSLDTLMLPVAATVTGAGGFRVRDGGLRENPVTAALSRSLAMPGLTAPGFEAWSMGYRLAGGRVLLDDGRLATRVGELAFGGDLGFDGSLDVGVRLGVAGDRLDSLALRRSGFAAAVAGRLGGASPVRIGLRLGGTVFDPSVRPEAALATGDLDRALRGEADARTRGLRDTARARMEEVRDTAAARLDAARDTAAARIRAEREALEARGRQEAAEARRRAEEEARGLLRGLLGGRRGGGADTATAADTVSPADSMAPDSVPPDAPAPDTTPPDTTASDTSAVRPAGPRPVPIRREGRPPSSAPFLRRSP